MNYLDALDRIARYDRTIPRWWLIYDKIRMAIRNYGHPWRSFVEQPDRH
jgi:hypothetical protein